MSEELIHISALPESQNLYADVCHIIDDTRTRVAVYVNSEVCMTNWRIGTRIKEDVLYNKRAEYGKQVIKNLSIRLTERLKKYAKSFTLLPKKANVIGLQVADLVAYPITRHILDPIEPNMAYEIIKYNIYTENLKQVGIKIIPHT